MELRTAIRTLVQRAETDMADDECLRIGSYQPFTWGLVKRHAKVVALCLLMALTWLLWLPEVRNMVAGACLTTFLVLLAVMDGYYGFLYDRLLLPLGALGLGLEFVQVLPYGLAESLLAAVLAGSFWTLVRFFSRGGIGWGDVKFAAVLGLWLGARGVMVAMALAVMMGGSLSFFLLALGRGRRMVMPFGPFLALGAYISYLCCDGLWQWYWELML